MRLTSAPISDRPMTQMTVCLGHQGREEPDQHRERLRDEQAEHPGAEHRPVHRGRSPYFWAMMIIRAEHGERRVDHHGQPDPEDLADADAPGSPRRDAGHEQVGVDQQSDRGYRQPQRRVASGWWYTKMLCSLRGLS